MPGGAKAIFTVNHNERHVRHAIVLTLTLTLVALTIGSVMHFFSPVDLPAARVVVPMLGLINLGLLAALVWRPAWALPISRTALIIAWLTMVVASWGFTLRASLMPGLKLTDVYPPASPFLPVLMFLSILFFPKRWNLRAVIFGWIIVASPVLGYLVLHVQELLSPRGQDLVMAFGPWTGMVIVLLPMQRGLTGRIERLMSEQALMKNAINRDALTGLFNRRLVIQIIDKAIDNQASAGLIMFDLDRFKAINDTHGHPVGDRVLRKVADQCQKMLRQDEIISRWGGEEFMVVLPDVGMTELELVAERLRAMIAGLSLPPVDGISASFGITLVGKGDDITSVLERVDRKMYEAKQNGGNCVAGLAPAQARIDSERPDDVWVMRQGRNASGSSTH